MMTERYNEGSLFRDSPQDILDKNPEDDFLLMDEPIDDSDALGLSTISDNTDNDLSDKLEFPCMVLSGLATKEEIEFFAQKYSTKENSLPLFVGIIKRIGMYELSMESLQILRMIADYTIVIHRAENDKVQLDLNNDETFINMIRI